MRSNECPCINEGSFRRCSMENSAICGDRGRVFTEGNARWVECRLILTFDRNMTREFGKALSVHRVTTSPFNPFALFSSRATARFVLFPCSRSFGFKLDRSARYNQQIFNSEIILPPPRASSLLRICILFIVSHTES